MDPAVLTLIVLGVAAFFFVTELIPLAVTAMGASIALGLLGVLTPKQVFSGLSNSTVVLFAGMFVIGAAMFQTGLAQRIGITVVHAAGTGEKRLMAAIMIVTIILSSVSSNTATVACLLPVVVQICAVARLAVSPQLMALAVAANVGGTVTMIGTPPNILMSATLSASGLQPFGFFEFAWIGIPLSIAGVIYMLTIGRRLCPHGHIDSNLSDLTSDLPKDTRKMAICAIILILVVVAMALSKTINVPMQTAAIIGALACVITGCLSEKQAYGGIDWTTIFLFAGMLPLAEAMDKTGAGAMIANGVVGIIGSNASPLIIVMALFLLSCGLTQFMSNTAAAALLAPIGISIAQSIGVSPFPVLMAIGIAASCAFTTPVATPPNTLILGPGKFHFMDYVKVGLPLVLVSMIVCTVIIPLVWPF
ncbi:MAG: SLC13 family permease [Mitsuokella jalaludinii]|uniref:SLC13 family permease n=1 Tax=Mitsuokella jalaludinii TaxID=187979 RepID=UPI000568949D|nr:SLC13 family permease [Mitsuokella jalaludinii]MCQ1532744.1 SLC13 family permease [Mitsuokella jalaludinii]MEE0481810.1 SLC13 family permease [Mitsuokella jalaludinii]